MKEEQNTICLKCLQVDLLTNFEIDKTTMDDQVNDSFILGYYNTGDSTPNQYFKQNLL